MKYLLCLLLLLPFLNYAQKSSFTGRYDKFEKENSEVYVYISVDSFKIVTLTLLQNGNNMSVDIKTGIWKLKGIGDYNNNNATLLFDDGTIKDISIYHTTATFEDGSTMDNCQMRIDDMFFVEDIFTNKQFRQQLKNKTTNF